MAKKILIIPGDGIGPEITYQAKKVLDAAIHLKSDALSYTYGFLGNAAVEKFGDPAPFATIQAAKESDAILIGTIGLPKAEDKNMVDAPDKYLIDLWMTLELETRIIAFELFEDLHHRSKIRSTKEKEIPISIFQILAKDLGTYEGSAVPGHEPSTTFKPTKSLMDSTFCAFEAASNDNEKLALIVDPGCPELSTYWERYAGRWLEENPTVEIRLLDFRKACRDIIAYPEIFNVLLADYRVGGNLCNKLIGHSGMKGLVATRTQNDYFHLYGPLQNSYPDRAGKNKANPLGSIISAAMMLGQLELETEMAAIHEAVEWSIREGYVTKDLDPNSKFGTSEIGDLIADRVMQTIWGIPLPAECQKNPAPI